MSSNYGRDIPQTPVLKVAKLRSSWSIYPALSAGLFAALAFVSGAMYAGKCPNGQKLFGSPAAIQKCDKCTCAEKGSCGKSDCGPCR